MFGGEDDDDFTPNPSSKLASLFGFGKSSDEGNASLTYTAPKQPKKGRAENKVSKGQEVTQPASSPAKLSIILVKAVHTYKLAEGNYNAQGKLGAAVLGNAATKVYQLLLYKGKQQHVTSCRITPQFQFVVQANNYATFYDDQTQNWSVMFESSEDAIEFAKEVGLARGNASKEPSEHQLMTQDLLFGVGSGASEGDSLEIRYIVYPLSEGKLGPEIENTTQAEKPLRVKLKKSSWEEGLLGAAKGCKRMIMLAPALTGHWKTHVPPDSGVMVEVDIGRIKSNRSDSGDSTDDTSIKARGASISEALTNSPKTHKASIISRMARMGQATLPLTGAIACNPSDSEETEEETNVVNKAPAKVRVTKSRPAAEKPVQNVMIPPQHVAVYQPLSVPWQQSPAPQPPQQFVRANGSMTYVQQSYPLQTVSTPQMYPVSTPPAVPSPESHMSVFLSETRTQNAEVRMGVAKVSDKVDQVLIKLDTMQQIQHRRESSVGVMEPSALLGSIQKLVSENEVLRTEVEEKRSKIDQLYSMLHSNMMETRNDSLVFTLQQEKAQLSADLGEARSRTSSLEVLVSSKGEELVSSQQHIKDLENKLTALQEELQGYEQRISDLNKAHQEAMQKLEFDATEQIKILDSLKQENSSLKEEIQHFQEDMRKLKHDTMGHTEHVQNLEQENLALKDRIRTLQAQKGSASSDVVSEVKKVMNVVYHQTAAQFSSGASYASSEIKQLLMATIRDVTLKYLEVQNNSSQTQSSRRSEEKSSKVPAQESSQTEKPEDKPYVKTEVPDKPSQSIKHEAEKTEVPAPSSSQVKGRSSPIPSEHEAGKLTSQHLDSEKLDTAAIAAKVEKSTVDHNKSEMEKPASQHPAGEIEKPPSEKEPPAPDKSEIQKSSSDPVQSQAQNVPEAQTREAEEDKSSHASKEKQSRDSSLERSWRPQPPPPPLFDDDDDDDDWLS